MRCPKCGAETKVTETRGIYRRRQCVNGGCRESFETRENPVTKLEFRRIRAETRIAR